MRTIDKGPEPSVLVDVRHNCDTWDDVSGQQKETLRQHLRDEQKGLCAYCMGRIKVEESNSQTQVEHWRPRTPQQLAGKELSDEEKKQQKERSFSWENLLGVCKGGRSSHGEKSAPDLHCDVSKGNQEMWLHPAKWPKVESLFIYTKAGEILCARDLDETVQEKLERDLDLLNLNHSTLMRNRKELRKLLERRLRSGCSAHSLLKKFPAGADTLEPYFEVARQYLEKKTHQMPTG